ncbi:EAL domain-containing protein [Paraglaciecola sp. L3A3]|uniref:EAL domain-containing protein n=1 Tax=Paraglaciecola sp. L3A3 TaxID=2686358 RepID=UPI00131A6AE8|nr:EAL domain-containing protein [Paraglaciecola sp. L3A3]
MAPYWIRYLITKFITYIMLSDVDGNLNGIEKWRISALRIVLLTGFVSYSLIALHSCIIATQLNLFFIVPLTLSFYIGAGLMLWFSSKYYTICAYSLLLLIFAASISINAISQTPTLALYGSIFIFSLPLAAFTLLNARVGLVCMLLNVIPFIALLTGFHLSQYFPPHEQFQYANVYVLSLIFIFFNICGPLGVARSSMAARRLNKEILSKNQDLQTQNDFYKTLFVDADIAKFVIDKNNTIMEVNLAAKQLLNYEKLSNNPPTYLTDLFDDFPSEAGEKTVNRSIDGKMKAFKLTRSTMFNKDNFILTLHDITAKVMLHKTLAAQTIINRQHKLSQETGLANRIWLEDKLNKVLSENKIQFCVIAFKINNAQFIEQKYSFRILPILLKELAKYWQIGQDQKSYFASVDNENLTIICEISIIEVRNTIQAFFNTLPKAIKIEEHIIPVDLKAGISFPDSTKCNAEKLINNALYTVNSSQSKITFYETSSLQRFIEHQEINILLEEAILADELTVVYQPKVKADGQLSGLEALMRWNSSVIGLVSPSVFIPIAEKSGLVPKITKWLITTICKQISRWQKQGLDLVPIALNISGIDLDQDKFQKHLIYSLLEYKINPKLIELELTESAISSNKEKALKTTKDLSNWGFTISLDDFGEGYSGLSKLISYPVKQVKIDRQFVTNIHLDERKSKVVEAIVAMCRVLNIEVLAEGTESLEEVDKLLLLGCENFQGYVFSKPLEPLKVQQLLLTKNVHTGISEKSKQLTHINSA